jgi:eukaryotic-like serine/threonine-protein kinase
MALAAGTRLGPYEVLAPPLGVGGMGEVYRARDTRLDRAVAIKILPTQFSSDPLRKQRFEREATTVSHLNHPHICALYDVGSQDGVDYLVMEYVEGETLAKRLEKGPLPLEQVLKCGAQIADALDKAHRSGVVHRDLKPGNIMLTTTGAKLLDFGLAKPAAPLASLTTLTATRQKTPVTEQNTIVGTFGYMSPEQVEGKELDGRSDIFSLGAVLYEMVTARKAFEGKSRLSVASAILEKEPALISSIKPMTPPVLEHAIRRCLRDPEGRWQAARDLALELQWMAEAGAQTGTLTPAGEQKITREWLAWSVAALLGVSAVLMAFLHWSERPPVAEPVRFELPLPRTLSGVVRLIANPSVLCRFLRFLSTEALPSTGVTQLHRCNEPLRHPSQPGLSLASCQLIYTAITAGTSRVAHGPLCLHAVANTPAGLMELVRSYRSTNFGLPTNRGGSAPHCRFRGLLSVYTRYGLHARQVAQRLSAPEASAVSLPKLLL